jgi:uncharacterized protein
VNQRISTFVAGGLLALALFSPAMAGPLEDGQAAHQKGDFTTAFQILRPLAEQGDARAQCALGLMYLLGQGVPQDYAQAVAWYRKAAEQGFADGQLFLGGVYENGLGVPQDYVRAHMWFNLAGASGNPDGVKARDFVAAKMTPAQIAEAQRLASEWAESHLSTR